MKHKYWLIILCLMASIISCIDSDSFSLGEAPSIPTELQGRWHIATYAQETSYPGIFSFHRVCDDQEICGDLLYSFQETSATQTKIAFFCVIGFNYLETIWKVYYKLIQAQEGELLFEVEEYKNYADSDTYDSYFRVGSEHTIEYWFDEEYLYISLDAGGTENCFIKD